VGDAQGRLRRLLPDIEQQSRMDARLPPTAAGQVNSGRKRGKKRTGVPEMVRFRLARRSTAPREARRRIRPQLRCLGYVDDVVDELLVAVGEAVTNAVLYGAPGSEGPFLDRITVSLRTDGTSCVIDVTSPKRDWIPGPVTCPEPTAERGRGLFIIDQLTDAWHITQSPEGTTLSMSRRLPVPAARRPARSSPADC